MQNLFKKKTLGETYKKRSLFYLFHRYLYDACVVVIGHTEFSLGLCKKLYKFCFIVSDGQLVSEKSLSKTVFRSYQNM